MIEQDLLNLSILHIVGSSKFGGATQIILSLANMAKQKGLRSAVLTDDPETIKACERLNIEVVYFEGIIRPIRPWSDLLAIFKLSRLLKKRRDAIVHTHTLKGGVVGRIAAYRANIPIIIHHNHGFSFQDQSSLVRKKIIGTVEKYAASRCDRIISVNQSDIDFSLRQGIALKQKFTCIPNGVNHSYIDSIQAIDRKKLIEELHLPIDSLLITVVARLFSEKGHPWLFKALSLIQEQVRRPVHLLMLGDGPHREKYHEDVVRLGIADKVHFLGHRTDALSIAKTCDFFVLPSLREGHSITIIEAMAMQVPIVATDIRGINNSVRNEQEALLVPPCDSEALARAIIRMANDKVLATRLKDNARKRFLDNFTETAMLERVWQVYKQVAFEKRLTMLSHQS